MALMQSMVIHLFKLALTMMIYKRLSVPFCWLSKLVIFPTKQRQSLCSIMSTQRWLQLIAHLFTTTLVILATRKVLIHLFHNWWLKLVILYNGCHCYWQDMFSIIFQERLPHLMRYLDLLLPYQTTTYSMCGFKMFNSNHHSSKLNSCPCSSINHSCINSNSIIINQDSRCYGQMFTNTGLINHLTKPLM